MTGTSKATAVSKGRSFGSMHSHFGFRNTSQRGCSSCFRLNTYGGERRAVFVTGSDLGRRIATQAVGISFQKTHTVSV
jgi:hypothetical protein